MIIIIVVIAAPITSFFVTLGVLGGGTALALWTIFAILGVKHLSEKKAGKRKQKSSGDNLGQGFTFSIFAGGVYFLVA